MGWCCEQVQKGARLIPVHQREKGQVDIVLKVRETLPDLAATRRQRTGREAKILQVDRDVTAGSVASGVTVGVSPADSDQFGSLRVSQLLAGGDRHCRSLRNGIASPG